MKSFNTHFLCLLLVLFHLSAFAHPKKYWIEIREAPIVDVVRLLAQMEGKGVVAPNKLEDKVTASFPSSPLNVALDAILESKDLGAIISDDVIRVATKKSIEALGKDLITKTFNLKYAKAKDIKEQAGSLISLRGSAMVDERTNSITVRDTKTYLENVATLINNIDRPDRQVLIEAKVVEATTDFTRSLGINWGLTIDSPVGSVTTNALTDQVGGIAVGFAPFSGGKLDIQLSAAEKEGKLTILSRPSIVTLNNKSATIRSGSKIYVKTTGGLSISAGGGEASSSGGSSGDASGVSSNLHEIVSGLTLTVTPQITADNRVLLAIDVIASQADFAKTVDGLPTIHDNMANTTVLLEDGATTVIGGLYQRQDSTNSSGWPFLRGVPILGALFGSTTKGNLQKELLIFIKPKIVM